MEALVDSLRFQGVIHSKRVSAVMKRVDRAKYVSESLAPYSDCPQPIGDGQTISAPHMHAQALEILEPFLQPGSCALDVGCGSGYLTSCMGLLVSPGGCVVGIENREDLVDLAHSNIGSTSEKDLLSSGTVMLKLGNGWTGEGYLSPGKEENVFDAIHVGAAADSMPEILISALKSPGRMVIPVGPQWGSQVFMVVDKDKFGSVTQRELMSVMYVPLEQQLRPRGS